MIYVLMALLGRNIARKETVIWNISSKANKSVSSLNCGICFGISHGWKKPSTNI
jgi:hypothetical protein